MNAVFKAVLIILGAVIVAGLLVGGCVYTGYNKAVRLDEQVDGQWAQVENQLQRRYDLIPNLVETVKGLAEQEKEIFLGVAEARKSYFQADGRDAKAQAATGVERALSRLLMLRERYPQLRSNEAFLKLQDQLEGTENRISVERKRYNDAVRALNTYRRELFGRFVTTLAGIDEAEYFEAPEEAQEVPQVNFTDETPAAEPAPETEPAAP
jgi:LemA protein